MDWVKEASLVFKVDKPDHFTNFEHCDECAEHDETLRNSTVDDIGLEELGNPGWDPICFSSAEGMKYYMPAFVRLCLDSVDGDFYFAQFIFHLEYGVENNKFLCACTSAQREFVAAFLEYMINTYPYEIEENMCTDEVLTTYQMWSKV